MCDPATAISLAVSAAGSYLETQEQNKNIARQQNAKNAAYAQNMQRQRQYADETTGEFKKSLENQGAEGLNQNIDDASAKRLQAFNDNRLSNADYSVATNNAPKNVVLNQQKTLGEAENNANRDNTNLARLGGYGDGLFNSGLQRNEFARAFGNFSDQASRDARLLPLDMSAAANNAYKAPSLFPTLLKAGGAAGASYAAAGMPGWDDVYADQFPAGVDPNVYGPNPGQVIKEGYGTQIGNIFGGWS